MALSSVEWGPDSATLEDWLTHTPAAPTDPNSPASVNLANLARDGNSLTAVALAAGHVLANLKDPDS